MAEWDDNTKAQVKKIPLLTENAGPRDPKEKWDARLKQVGERRAGAPPSPRISLFANSGAPVALASCGLVAAAARGCLHRQQHQPHQLAQAFIRLARMQVHYKYSVASCAPLPLFAAASELPKPGLLF
jgi:hypothetical protein